MRLIAALLLAALVTLPSKTFAAPITFFGNDPFVNANGPRPNSDAAAAAFQAASSGLTTIDFENMSLGSLADGTITDVNGVADVDLTTSGLSSGFPKIDNLNNPGLGFNTTSGGSQFLGGWVAVGPLIFDFATPISAFGAYITGLGSSSGSLALEFNDGSSQSFDLTTLIGSDDRGAAFFGFTDAGKSITQVQFVNSGSGGDVYGIDDVQFGAAVVPEPTSMALFGLTALGFGVGFRRRRNSEELA